MDGENDQMSEVLQYGLHIGHDESVPEETDTAGLMRAVTDQPYMESTEDYVMDEVIQYAYQNDLTADHLLSSFSPTHLFGKPIQSSLPFTEEDGFTNSGHLAGLEVPDILLHETLTITDSAFKLICEAHHVLQEEKVKYLAQEACQSASIQKLKLELPILHTDNDWDTREFRREQLARQHIPIKNHRLPLDIPDNEAGEGMELSTSVRSECKAMVNKLMREKLEVTRDSLEYLVCQLKFDYTRKDQMSYLIGEIKYKKNLGTEKLTPPISPKFGQNYYMPPVYSCLVPIPEDNILSPSENFRVIEDALLKEHQDVWAEMSSPIRGLLENEYAMEAQEPFIQNSTERLGGLKIELPLVLDQGSEQPILSGKDALTECIKTHIHLDPGLEKAVIKNFSDNNLSESLRMAESELVRSIEQEQLQEVDAVARIPIPIMDFSISEPGWTKICINERGIFKWIQAGNEELYKPPSWPIHKAAEGRLIWTPLSPGITFISEKECIKDGEQLVEYFTGIPSDKDTSTSADFVQMRGQVIVLQDSDGDEEIETQLFSAEPKTDLIDLARKRSHGVYSQGKPNKLRHTVERSLLDRTTEHFGPPLLPKNSSELSSTLLASFMEIHAPRKTWTQSKYFGIQRNNQEVPPVPTDTLQSTRTSEEAQAQLESMACSQITKPGIQAPCPAINPPSTPLTIFISIKIPRRVIRCLESLIPHLTMVERDYDAHNTFIWRPSSVIRTQVVTPMANDAEITVSPSTGLIITSMIKVRQRPKVGTTKGMVQVRIENASLRYERLVVLVSGEGGSDDSLLEMSSSDSTALIELQGFGSGLDCNVHVRYVGGGDTTLAKWAASCICKYSIVDTGLQNDILETETLWELFLRRAGFNVFAAQAVASHLKSPHLDAELAQPMRYGLGAFVTMTRAERMHRFGQLVGPRVLERVNTAVDELWNQG